MAKLANNENTPKGWLKINEYLIPISNISYIFEGYREVTIHTKDGGSYSVNCKPQDIYDIINANN